MMHGEEKDLSQASFFEEDVSSCVTLTFIEALESFSRSYAQAKMRVRKQSYTEQKHQLSHCLRSIQEGNSWSLDGEGKLEVLKGMYEGYKGVKYKGVISRYFFELFRIYPRRTWRDSHFKLSRPL